MGEKSLDELIKKSLELYTDDIHISPNILGRIQSRMAIRDTLPFRNWFTDWNPSNRLGLALGVILMISVICCMLSKDTRAMAASALKMVKSIFVLENEGNHYRVAEKPVEKVGLTIGVSEFTQLTDAEIAKKVGFKVSLPKTLAYGYTLKDKALGVRLNKTVNYDMGVALNQRLNHAIEDDQEFKDLRAFKPERDICGVYKNKQAAVVFINISKSLATAVFDEKTVTIGAGKIKAKWLESPFPVYRLKNENGIKSPDMTQKPTDIKITHSLYWEYGGLSYSLNSHYPLRGKDLTLEEAVKIAESFIQGQCN